MGKLDGVVRDGVARLQQEMGRKKSILKLWFPYVPSEDESVSQPVQRKMLTFLIIYEFVSDEYNMYLAFSKQIRFPLTNCECIRVVMEYGFLLLLKFLSLLMSYSKNKLKNPIGYEHLWTILTTPFRNSNSNGVRWNMKGFEVTTHLLLTATVSSLCKELSC